MTRRTLGIVAAVAILTTMPCPAIAQDSIDAAATLYSSAAYDDALNMLNRLPEDGMDVSARASVDHYRMLCQLALGRSRDVEATIARLLDQHPTYVINQDDVSPRVTRTFNDVRRRVLPEVMRRRYEAARALASQGDHAGAAAAFGLVRQLIAQSSLAGSEPMMVELGSLAARAEDLSREAIVAEQQQAAHDAAVAAAAAEAEARAAAPPAAPPAPADGIYTVLDRDVVAPVAVRQDVRRWFGPMPPPPAGTPLGEVQFVIDETGAVSDLAVVTSVSAFYDAVVVESVKNWRYQPATRNGQPVKFRRVVSLLAR